MATCDDCNREMTLAASCVVNAITLRGELYRLDVYRVSPRSNHPTARCHDCGARPGGYHHPGCDMTECPRCGGQLLSCGCGDIDDEDDEDDEDGAIDGVVDLRSYRSTRP